MLRRPPGAPLSQRVPDRLRLNLDGYRLCLFVLTVLTISRIHQHFSILKSARPGLLLVAFAGLFAVLNIKGLAGMKAFQAWPARVILAFLVLACVSAPFGISLGAAGSFILSDYSKTILYAVFVLMALRTASDLFTFAWAYVIGTAVLAWMAYFVFGLSTYGSQAARLGNLYAWDGNDVGVLMLIGLAFTVLTFQTSGRLGRYFSLLMLPAIGITIGRTGSRGAFLGLVACTGALLFMLKTVPVRKRLGFVAAVAISLVVFAPPGYWAQMGTITNIKEDYNWSSVDGRRQIIMRGLKYMGANPVFGLGINNFMRAECLDPNSEKVRNYQPGTGSALVCKAPHNSYLQAGAELGIPGLLLWLLMVFGGIKGMFGLRRRLPMSWSEGTPEERFLYRAPLYLGVAMVAFAVSSTFVGFAWLDPVYFLAAMMAGVYSITEARLRHRKPAVARSARRRVTAPVAALRQTPPSWSR
jgi:O-antigen ligase